MSPTSTWNGLPLVTLGSRVTVETNRESMALDKPFLISKSSMGDRQSVGGDGNRTLLNAANKLLTSSGLRLAGLRVASNPASEMTSSHRLLLIAENVFRRKYRSGVRAPPPSLGADASRSSR